MHKKVTTTLEHPSQLRALNVWRFKRTRGLGRLEFHETFRHEERDRWQRDLNRYYYACGCDTGAKGFVIFTLAAAAFCIWQWSHGKITLPHAAFILAGSAVAGGILGKLVGLAIAGRKLELLKRAVVAAWKIETPLASAQDNLCG